MPESGPPDGPGPTGPGRRVLTVSELTHRLKDALEAAFGAVWLTGEVSNLRRAPSGHVYLTLKDAGAQIRAVIWGSTARYLRRLPSDGDQVLCRGRIMVYEPRGDYQVILDYLEPAGVGDLYRQFAAVKARLEAEGLFEPARKRPLPALVHRVAVVTSPAGAAIRDVLNVLGRRAPGMRVVIAPAAVQGRNAPGELIAALEAASRHGNADAVVVARGGGSLEDLMAFNDEALARAIAACPIPVVSGVGHETDVTIADLVADVRAPTPSAAAELISTPWVEWRSRVEQMQGRLAQAVHTRMAERRLTVEKARAGLVDPAERLQRLIQRVDDLRLNLGRLTARRIAGAIHVAEGARVRLLAASPGARIPDLTHRTEALATRAERAVRVRAERAAARLAGVSGRLEGLSPMGVLARGFAVARKQGRILKDAAQAEVGDRVAVRLHRGELACRVEERRLRP